MIGQGVSSRSSHSEAAGRTTSLAKPCTQSRTSFWSWVSSSENVLSPVSGSSTVGARAPRVACGGAGLPAAPAGAEPGRMHGRGPPEPPPHAQGPQEPRSPGSRSQPRSCTPHAVAYVAADRLVSNALVPDGGEPTPTVARAA